MTRPSLPEYPFDTKYYHDMRHPGFSHTIRLPEELLQPYVNLKLAQGLRTTHTDVIRFLFEAAEVAIQAVEELLMEDPDMADPEDTGDVAGDPEDSNPEVLDETGRTVVVLDRFDPVVIQDSQVQGNPQTSRVTDEATNAF
ncbi:hypothetical protein R1sor_007571 [Riccia sorocarpa]|uniref:Uncharacterized protein n=1 Tax=Riccia sorocarpa TaxID=122646 RepID=A0ABD3HV11_9MARC